jgi:hypothetical protein
VAEGNGTDTVIMNVPLGKVGLCGVVETGINQIITLSATIRAKFATDVFGTREVSDDVSVVFLRNNIVIESVSSTNTSVYDPVSEHNVVHNVHSVTWTANSNFLLHEQRFHTAYPYVATNVGVEIDDLPSDVAYALYPGEDEPACQAGGTCVSMFHLNVGLGNNKRLDHVANFSVAVDERQSLHSGRGTVFLQSYIYWRSSTLKLAKDVVMAHVQVYRKDAYDVLRAAAGVITGEPAWFEITAEVANEDGATEKADTFALTELVLMTTRRSFQVVTGQPPLWAHDGKLLVEYIIPGPLLGAQDYHGLPLTISLTLTNVERRGVVAYTRRLWSRVLGANTEDSIYTTSVEVGAFNASLCGDSGCAQKLGEGANNQLPPASSPCRRPRAGREWVTPILLGTGLLCIIVAAFVLIRRRSHSAKVGQFDENTLVGVNAVQVIM